MTWRSRTVAIAAAAAAAAWFAPAAQAVNYSSPATYKGTTATGGSVEFDVSGNTIPRFTFSGVRTSCVDAFDPSHTYYFEPTDGVERPISIVNDEFSYLQSIGAGLELQGEFLAPDAAQGSIAVRWSWCEGDHSQPVSWNATAVPDLIAPQTTIDSGPSGRTTSRTARFRFTSSETGSTFQCKIDTRAWRGCRSARTYENLRRGKHTFRVRARDQAGNTDPSPARRTWRVVSGGA